ncbi:MAG TPA: replication-associated recombination protein A [Candidatus Onthoplasma faecigallinarum]|nr:replication-associated recombination protein A [Candidatus Onthoplasma faecigallinarum]
MSTISEELNVNNTPLAERMRAQTLEEFVGQKHIVGKDSLIRRALKVNRLGSCIFYGPPGVGKTTLAFIIAKSLDLEYKKLNAVSSGVADAKKVIEQARSNFELTGKSTVLILDECHRWNKAQSDSVLEAVERGYITFIGTTTENPHISMTPAIVSRCRIFKFLPLAVDDIKDALIRAIKDKARGYGRLNIKADMDAINHIAMFSNGDLRSAYNALELAVTTTPLSKDNSIHIDKLVASQCIQQPVISIDENLYYDMLSAFCKSLRGSDTDAALYYAERLIKAGCDPLLICRRLIAHASEDVGMADSNAALLAMVAMNAVKNLGMPEGNIPLAHAIIYVCEAEKSNSVVEALNAAKYDAEFNPDDNIPEHLKNYHYDVDNPPEYKYPHDYGGYVKQQYLPDKLKDRIYYKPSNNGRERGLIRKKTRNK